MTGAEFDQYYQKYKDIIRAIARKLARQNDALVDDLTQEGLIALSRCHPERAIAKPDAYIRQSVKFRMIDYLRKDRPAAYDSLDLHLANGAQLTRDDDGDMELIFPEMPRREDGDGYSPRLRDEEEEE
jgi:RNA polymerase sigma factor (sigma-70 family)